MNTMQVTYLVLTSILFSVFYSFSLCLELKQSLNKFNNELVVVGR